MTLAVGDIVIARFPEQDPQGHEQEGLRPAVVVGNPEALGKPRFAITVVIPLTSYRSQSWVEASPALYPRLKAGEGLLPQESVALLEQIRALDRSRVVRYLGTLTPRQYKALRSGLKRLLSG
ncbi:type II toxin-antitoxin system PemK/MazF family toxin [Gloeobacter violaceus]|uniref:Glr2425 protein n=1 Tax=Gloeobacter violaceus (strain ATCC 29082 / PCC 7421) TaxID=251221 RepID=Q7NHW0_GLOVI|nr:type II toxin-antitoxin system PemK/MazF family toxin [Gloeobacter violaceus]BAC90366.1 glr2425 [Gloeobacter violaceus PCC 7421]